ncbi:Uncharacterised protein [uncultured archaeon]|nr:Uncharacterised protein [uncultured archaeon]
MSPTVAYYDPDPLLFSHASANLGCRPVGIRRKEDHGSRGRIGVIDPSIGIKKSVIKGQNHSRNSAQDLIRFAKYKLHLMGILAVFLAKSHSQLARNDAFKLYHASLGGGDSAL